MSDLPPPVDVTPTTPPTTPRVENVTTPETETPPVSETPVATMTETATAAPVEMQQRSASEAYVFAAVLCAVVGLIIPVLPAAAALMLTRATDDDMTSEPLRPQLLGVKSFARGLAWFDLAWMTLLTLAFLLSTLGRVIG